MTILDSNVWIAFFNESDNQHKKAEKVFRKIGDSIIITEYVILEVASVLTIRASKNIADKFIEFVVDNENIKILLSNENSFKRIVKNFLNYPKSNLSFVDISLLNLSGKYDIITFDKNLEKAVKKTCNYLKSIVRSDLAILNSSLPDLQRLVTIKISKFNFIITN